MELGHDLPTDPEALVGDDAVLSFEDYVETVTAVSDEFRFRLVYAVRVLNGPTVEDVAEAVDRPVEAVEPVLEDLIDAGVVAEKMACIVDCDQDVYETSILGQRYLESGPIAALQHERE